MLISILKHAKFYSIVKLAVVLVLCDRVVNATFCFGSWPRVHFVSNQIVFISKEDPSEVLISLSRPTNRRNLASLTMNMMHVEYKVHVFVSFSCFEDEFKIYKISIGEGLFHQTFKPLICLASNEFMHVNQRLPIFLLNDKHIK